MYGNAKKDFRRSVSDGDLKYSSGSSNEEYSPKNKTCELSYLTKYPSFQNLENKKQTEMLEKINAILRKGHQEKWIIDHRELKIEYPAATSGTCSNIHYSMWRDIEIVVKTPKYKRMALLCDLVKEIEIWSSLRHPNLVQFLGISFDKTNDDFFILMDKVEGCNLKDFIKLNNTLPKKIKLKICQQLINIIKFIHSCKPPIIYRDLKPENIMIDAQNTVKLIDFGLSRFMPETNNYRLTGGTGTVRYMAPEVFLKQDYGLNVDVYSLGLIMYFVYTGITPFTEYDINTITTYFNTSDLIFNTQNIQNKAMRHIINMCIKKDKNERWGINELSEEFDINRIMEQSRSAGCYIS